jgi:hypothetical protein
MSMTFAGTLSRPSISSASRVVPSGAIVLANPRSNIMTILISPAPHFVQLIVGMGQLPVATVPVILPSLCSGGILAAQSGM